MKILRIEVTNLNSLYDTHVVDLERALSGASLFLIHGPMGTGKSTLMDAVSLALFGKTPRLDGQRVRDNRRNDWAPQQIMSRGTGACRASIVFSKLETGGRRRYRATWSCRRARERADGAFQTPNRSLERQDDTGAWELLVSDHRQKVFAPAFERVLEGFTVEDFNRSMLLAQGRFDAFLKAEPEERAQILERLTQTGIYQSIGQHAAMISGRHNTRLRRLRTLAAGQGGLDAAEHAALLETHEALKATLAERQSAAQQAQARLGWIDTAKALATSLAEATAEGAVITRDSEAAAPRLKRLAEHERCAAAEGFKALDEAQRTASQRDALAQQRQAVSDAAPALAKAAEAAQAAATRADRDAATASDDLERLRPQVQGVTDADTATREATQRAEATRKEHAAATTKRAGGEAGLARSEAAVVSAKAAEATAAQALAQRMGHPSDEATTYAAVHEGHQAELTTAQRRLERLSEAMAPAMVAKEARAALTALGREATDAKAKVKSLEGQVATAAQAVTTRREAAQAASVAAERTQRIADLVVHRGALVDGEACPLCGAEDHPWTGDPDREREDAEIAETLAHALADRDQALAEVTTAEAAAKALEGEQQRLLGRLEQLEGEAARATARQETLDQEAQAARAAAEVEAEADLNAAVETAKATAEAAAQTLKALEAAHTTAQSAQATRREAEAAAKGQAELVAEYRAQEASLKANLEAAEVATAARQKEAQALHAALQVLWESIVAAEDGRPEGLFPPKGASPTVTLKAQQGWVERAQTLAKEATQAHGAARDAVQENTTRQATLAEQHQRAEGAHTQSLAGLDAALKALEVEDAEALQARRLTPEELLASRGARQALEARRIANTALVEERTQGVSAHAEARPEGLEDGVDRDQLSAVVEAAEAARSAAAEAADETAGRLKAHDIQVAQHAEARRALREAEQTARVWETLHEIIGQNNGGRFQQFAQALNLGQLLEKANVHLQRLAERYRLVPRMRDGLPTLSFDLEDLWQVGQRVSPQSLSGGERFLVSLALALGLSDFRGGSVRMPVETLLLDEGFGTLDPDTLNIAMGALSQLQADGRQVGIISHVVGLTERIEATVEVRPLGGGRSEVITSG